MMFDVPLDALALAALIGAASAIICWFARPIARRLHIMDVPDPAGGRKRHRMPTPLVGGLAIMLPAIVATVTLTNGGPSGAPLSLALVSGGFLLIGLIDDRSHIRPSYRLAISWVLCWIALYYTPSFQLSFLRFSFLPYTLFLDEWGILFTALCLVGLQNAINMADGKNGLVTGQILIWLAFILFYAPGHLRPLLVVMMIGAAITMAFNLRGRLFLGDAGSYAISVMIGLLAIYVYNQNFTRLPADMPALWFLVPVLDCLRLMISRVVRAQSPFTADRNHLHHLLAAVMPWKYGLIVYLGLVGMPGILGLAAPELTLLWIVVATLGYAIIYTGLSRRIATRAAIFR